MKIKKRIGFIGCGNMGSAILNGMLSKKMVTSKQIIVFDAAGSKLNSIAKKYRVKKASGNRDLVRNSEVVILAVKPQEFHSVAAEIRSELSGRHLVISILARTPLAKIKKNLGSRCQVSRAMPNLGAVVGEGITAVTGSSRKAEQTASAIFSSCGEVVQLSERYFDLITAVSGSGPAYFFLLMELLSLAAQKGGLSKQTANLLAVQTSLGAARVAKDSTHDPAGLRVMVTSKKGTTDAALRYLSKKGFASIFIQAVGQAVKRAKQLSKL